MNETVIQHKIGEADFQDKNPHLEYSSIAKRG